MQLRKKMKNLQKINLKAWKCDLNDREFKTAILKKLNKLQKNTGSLINSEVKSQTKGILYKRD